ncbi:phage holin family protein [Ornithobacterium rhinotracheale]|nr:phage holin family protein [Ornithobacterium rhinotracheale]
MQLWLVVSVWVVVLVAMIVDLIYGVRKAKALGEARTSEGYRRTINKFVFYYSMMSFALMFDFLDVITPVILPHPLPLIPLFSILGAVALVLTEVKSVYEKAEDKLRRKTDRSVEELIRIFKNREDLMGNVLEILREEKQKQDDQKTNENELQ